MDFYDVQEEEDEFNALENAHANSCFSDESLVELAGTDVRALYLLAFTFFVGILILSLVLTGPAVGHAT